MRSDKILETHRKAETESKLKNLIYKKCRYFYFFFYSFLSFYFLFPFFQTMIHQLEFDTKSVVTGAFIIIATVGFFRKGWNPSRFFTVVWSILRHWSQLIKVW